MARVALQVVVDSRVAVVVRVGLLLVLLQFKF